MAALAAADLNELLDAFCGLRYELQGVSLYGFLESGDRVDEMVGAVQDSANAVAQRDLLGAILRLQTNVDVSKWMRLYGNETWRAIQSHFRREVGGSNAGTFDSYLKFLNVDDATKWQALQDGRVFRALYNDIYGGTNYPSVQNCYFEVLQGTLNAETHLYTDALGKFVVSGAGAGAFTQASVIGELVDNGSAKGQIDETKYVGGFGKIKASSLSGSGNVTVTGNFYDPATEAVMTGKTSITSISGAGPTTMVAGGGTMPTDGLLLEVTNCTIAAGITAGTLYFEAHRPSGRPLIG